MAEAGQDRGEPREVPGVEAVVHVKYDDLGSWCKLAPKSARNCQSISLNMLLEQVHDIHRCAGTKGAMRALDREPSTLMQRAAVVSAWP
jgi:hypothetical protein